MKKYQLTSETITVNGRTLHRIQALRDFADVKASELGGFVESESNLSQEGDCWVYDNAMVYDNALVCDNATVSNEGVVCDNALVCEYAKVSGNGYVKDDATIFGDENVEYCAVANICDDITEDDFFDNTDCEKADAETREHFGITEPISLEEQYYVGDADEDELQKQADAYFGEDDSDIDELFAEMYDYFENIKIKVRNERIQNYVNELRKKANCK